MFEIAVDDRRDGLADAIDARHQRAPGDEADQEACDREHGNGARQPIPKALLQRRKQPVVSADQQVVLSQQGNMHQRRLHPTVAQIDFNAVVAGCCRDVRPDRKVAGQPVPRCVGQQQDSVTGNLHANPGIDEVFQALRAIATVDVGEPLRIGLQDFRAAFLDRALPCVPQRRGEQHQRQQSQDHVSERERHRGRANHTGHRCILGS